MGKVVFSGDIGNRDQPIIRDPQYIRDADYVLTESTYGDRNHAPVASYTAELAKIIRNGQASNLSEAIAVYKSQKNG